MPAFEVTNLTGTPRKTDIEQRGFTLIELLIVVALIGILSTVILANYNSFGRRQEVRNGAENLKSEIRKYQTFAIAGQKDPTQNPSSTCVVNTLERYEIIVTQGVAPEFEVNIICALSKLVTDQSPWSIRVTLEEVGSYDPGPPPAFSPSNQISINFQPVNKGAFLESGGAPTNSVYVKLSNDAGSAIYYVIVTSAGEIYVEKE